MDTVLVQQKCTACEGGIPPMNAEQIAKYRPQIDAAWEVIDDKKIRRAFKFKDFKEAMVFVNSVANLAEEQGHHPDISIYYSKVVIELWTHKINGLFLNDFILAAKIDEFTV